MNSIISSNHVLVNSPRNYTKAAVKRQIESRSHEKNENLKKAVILTASIAGMLAGIKLVGKMQNLKTFTLEGYRKINYDTPAMTTIAGASLIGGLGAGLALDFEDRKNKIRESIQQMIGNIIFPIFTVTQGKSLFEKFKNKIKMPQIKNDTGFAKVFNHASKNSPQVAATAALLGAGLFMGNKFANFVNDLIFNKKEQRDVKFSDLSAHVDDLCFATTLVTKGTNFGHAIAKLIPPALIVPGYVAGTKKNFDNH